VVSKLGGGCSMTFMLKDTDLDVKIMLKVYITIGMCLMIQQSMSEAKFRDYDQLSTFKFAL
jgi:hypothetical protein